MTPTGCARFEQEARAAAALNHPNIIAVFDVGATAASPTSCSELLEGETLRAALRRAAVPPRKAIDLPRRSRRDWRPRTAKASCTAT